MRTGNGSIQCLHAERGWRVPILHSTHFGAMMVCVLNIDRQRCRLTPADIDRLGGFLRCLWQHYGLRVSDLPLSDSIPQLGAAPTEQGDHLSSCVIPACFWRGSSHLNVLDSRQKHAGMTMNATAQVCRCAQKRPIHMRSSSGSPFLKLLESSLLSRIRRCRYCRLTPDSLAA